MANEKIDYLIEAVRFCPDGKIDQVRGYERRGATYSDLVLVNRLRLIEFLTKKKKVATGKRIAQQASTFEVFEYVAISGEKDSYQIHMMDQPAEQDSLGKLPIF